MLIVKGEFGVVAMVGFVLKSGIVADGLSRLGVEIACVVLAKLGNVISSPSSLDVLLRGIIGCESLPEGGGRGLLLELANVTDLLPKYHSQPSEDINDGRFGI